MTNALIEIQNLRNKYEGHTVIKPLIQHCNEKKISFEFLKETIPAPDGVKSYNKTSTYYMKIGENLFTQEENQCRTEDLCKLISNAYNYLQIKQPDNLADVRRNFKRKN